ncbi:MAG TPA: RQC domain-containing protein, partial [Reyranella sp.]|nr:RQC domain-containing protein [Reyranella sp.]
CQEDVERHDGTIEAQKIMSAIVRTGERFGMEHLIAILCGERTDNVLKFQHDRLPTFGVGADRRNIEWRTVFRQLSALGLISQDLMQHGRWSVTDEGWSVLKGKARIELRKDLAGPKASRRERQAASPPAAVEDADAALLAALKSLRSKLAQASKVPAYVVFSDRTLIELATHRPASLNAMREIHGVGDSKLERYGPVFLDVMQNFGR